MRYDADYSEEVTLKGGERVRLRTVRPTDKQMMVDALERLSPESRYRRFFTAKTRLTAGELRYLTEFDGIHHYAIGAGPLDGSAGYGVARLVALKDEPTTAELAVLIADELQGQGLGSLMMRRLLEAACERGIRRVYTEVLANNKPMKRLMEHLGLDLEVEHHGTVVTMSATNPCKEPDD